ncbi:Methylosome subunit pICln [Caenorhabditis elegans]|uniref:Methylosome subunit pICln n=1 Tax=Caenorhabditis elegans TaxID=6239 RepID=G5EG22_CAEEL|nr:Methylosome subunit pICln [Caenorhabditis elegans]AAK69382.1 ICln2 [Caenorhabditis elegans]CAD21589.1 Methylosome subunit pICln [Caenorhabditis elegans]|eukprot:NP_001021288.1 ICLN (ICLn) ion channel homolog [Caenorhabditis elegans]
MILTEVSQPTEGIKLATTNVQAFFKIDSLGNGTLYITDSAVIWISSAAGTKGFSVAYPAIVLHAISTDVSVFPSEHIFVMVDQRKSVRRRRRAPVLRTIQEDDEQRGLELAAAELEDEESDDDEEEPALEIRFVPDDKDSLSQIYHQIAVGQEENPEEDDPMYDDEEEEMEEEMGDDGQGQSGQWFTADNIDHMQMSEEGLANMQRIFGRGDQHQHHHNEDESME